MPIHDKVMQFATEKPDCTAVSIGGERISYKELWEKTTALYSFFYNKFSLNRSPKNTSTTIALIMGNRLEFTEYYLASTMGDHVCAIIDPHTPEIPLTQILSQLNPECIVIDGEYSNINHVVFKSKYDYLITDSHIVKPCTIPYPDLPIEPVGEFLIGFTSGTTSTPKAYIRSKPAWRKSFELGYDVFELSSSSKTICPCPFSHGIGLYCLNEVLYSGGSFYSLPSWNNEECIDVINNESIDRLVMVPSMVVSLNKQLNNGKVLKSITHVVTAGAKLDTKKYHIIRDNFPNATIKEYYGASELGFMSVSHLDDDNISTTINSVGTTFTDVTIVILDDHGNTVPSGEIGTIYVDSPLISDGYLWGGDNAGFQPHQRATVGDIGYVDSDGYLYVVGRKDGMVVTGGFNVYPSEVETVIKNVPDIIEASIITIADEYLGSKLIAFIQSESDTVDSLIDICTKALPKYKIPREFYQLSDWPLTSSGKIKKTELQLMLQNEDGRLVKLSTK